jgi:hypothetical protein
MLRRGNLNSILRLKKYTKAERQRTPKEGPLDLVDISFNTKALVNTTKQAKQYIRRYILLPEDEVRYGNVIVYPS